MLRYILPMAFMVCPLLAVSSAIADPWKDESGHRKHWKEWKQGWGELPWWKRGKGYWDGHFKHRRWRPSVYGTPPYDYAPTQQDYFAPLPPPVFYDEHWWKHDGFQE